MLTLKKVRIKNFLTFGNTWTDIELDSGEFVLFLGDNRDTGTPGYSKNGVGKSNVFKAICFALFGDTADKVKVDNYINFTNGKEMEVSLDFILNGTEYTISRGRKPSKFEMLRNGVAETQTSDNADAEIVSLLGYDLDIFLNTICLVNSDDNRPFLAMKPAEQRNFMENFLSLTTLSERAESVKGSLKDISAEVRVEQTNLDNQKANNDRVAADLVRLKTNETNWESDKVKKLKDLEQKLKELESIDKDKESALHEEIDELEGEIRALDSKISSARNEITEIKANISTIQSMYDRYRSLIESEKKKDEEIESKLQESKDILSSINEKEMEECLEMHRIVKQAKEKHQTLVYSRKTIETDISSIEKDLIHLQEEHTSLSGGICPRCKQKYVNDAEIDSVDTAIENAKSSLSDKKKELDTVNSDIAAEEQIIEEGKALKSEADCISSLSKLEHAQRMINNPPSNDFTALRVSEENALKDVFDVVDDIDDKIVSSNIAVLEGELTEKTADLTKLTETLETSKQALTKKRGEVSYSKEQLSKLNNDIENIKSTISSTEETKNPYTTEIEHVKKQHKDIDETIIQELKKQEEHHKILVKLLTDSKSFIRKNMVDQYIPFINKKANEYLQMLGSANSVEINPDMTVDLYYNTHVIGYGSISKGQKLRMNLATSLAFRDFNSMLGKGSNVLMMDEYLDNGLCQDGFLSVVDLLKKTKIKNVMVISHREEMIPMVDKVVNVIMEHGFTSIEVN